MPDPNADEPGPDAASQPPARAWPAAEPPYNGPVRNGISARQLAANRRNARRSTGPTSDAGKQRSARNAIKHGAYASPQAIERGPFREDPLAIQAVLDDHHDVLQPRNELERDCVDRIARAVIQLNRYEAFQTRSLTEITTPPGSTPDEGDIHDTTYDAELYHDLARILRRDPSTYTTEEWDDLLLGASIYDPTLREHYLATDADDTGTDTGLSDLILASIRDHHGGTLEEAATDYEDYANHQRERLPDPARELSAAREGLKALTQRGTLDVHSKTLSRLSATLDAALRRYETIRRLTDLAEQTTPPTAEPAP